MIEVTNPEPTIYLHSPEMGKKNRRNKNAATSGDDMSEVSSMMSFSTAASERSESDHVEYIDDDSKFKMMVDEIGNKNSKTSVPALKFVFTKMQQMPMTSLLASQKLTLSTELYRALRKSKNDFRVMLLKCIAVLFLSLDEEDANEIFEDVQRELLASLKDKVKDAALALGIVTSTCFNPDLVCASFAAYRDIIKRAYLKGDAPPILKGTDATLVTSCLEAWSYLIAATSHYGGFGRLIEKEIDVLSPELPGILRSASVDVRLAASEAATIATEIARDFRGDEYDFDNVDDMLECLDDLAQGTAVGGGSVKSLKKNDRKNQKMTVRNTRDLILDRVPADVKTVQISIQEQLELDNYCDITRYEGICWCLEGGVNMHLTYNELLRNADWFELGSIVPRVTKLDKLDAIDKLHRQVIRGQIDKNRNNARKKERQNRADDHYYD